MTHYIVDKVQTVASEVPQVSTSLIAQDVIAHREKAFLRVLVT